MPISKPASPNPLSGLYEFVRAHLLIANNLALAAATLVAALDFLTPRLSLAPAIVYSATVALLLLMVAAAAAPALIRRLISATGYGDAGNDLLPLWRRPDWQFAVAILLGVSVLGWASVAKAGQGGLIASSSPAARSFQERLLGVEGDVAAIKMGVDSANGKLNGLVADSRDPQRELVARGYDPAYGLAKALRAGDARAVDLFVKVGEPVRREGPLAILLTDSLPLESGVAHKLPRSMFGAEDSCKAGHLFQYGEIENRLAQRVALFKRLCDPKPVVATTQEAIRRDAASGASDPASVHRRSVRAQTLALLLG